MRKTGFIGYGSMGSMLVRRFIASGKICPSEIIISTRTLSKLDLLKAEFNDISITARNTDVAKAAKYIFLCVKPNEVKNVLDEIRETVTPDTNIISLASPVKNQNIEIALDCKVTKLTPSLPSEIGKGVSLVCHNHKITEDEAEYIETLLSAIGTVKVLKEEEFELAAEVTSCGPGLIASIFGEFAASASRHTNSISPETITEMLLLTLSGTSGLLTENKLSFDEIIKRVATKGGITEEGVKVFRERLPEVFDEMFEKTLDKRKALTESINKTFEEAQ